MAACIDAENLFQRAKTCNVVWENGYGNSSRANPGRDTSACRAKRHLSGDDERAPKGFRYVGNLGLVLQANQEGRGQALP